MAKGHDGCPVHPIPELQLSTIATVGTRPHLRWTEALGRRAPVILAWSVRLNAVLTVLEVFRPGVSDRLARTSHSALLDGCTLALAVGAAGAQLVLANGLRQRKRRS